MSFYSDLMADAVLPTDVRTALSLTGDTGSVYGGKRFDHVKRDTDVWVERVTTSDVSGDGAQNISEHQVRVNIRINRPEGTGASGLDKLQTVEAHLETLTERYNGLQPFTALTKCYTIKAEEEDIEIDEEDARIVTGTVLLSFFVKKP